MKNKVPRKSNIKQLILSELKSIKLPFTRRRGNVSRDAKNIRAVALGEVWCYKSGRTNSQYNKKYSKLYSLLKNAIEFCHTEFNYKTIQVNNNIHSLHPC